MNIRPVSDLRNKYAEVEAELKESGAIYLTKNGYGTAVLIGLEEYIALKQSLISEEDPSESKASIDNARGFLSKYANPDLIPLEKNAGKLHAMKKYGLNQEALDE